MSGLTGPDVDNESDDTLMNLPSVLLQLFIRDTEDEEKLSVCICFFFLLADCDKRFLVS